MIAFAKELDANQSTSTPVVAQNQPNINANESSNDQATSEHLSVPATSDIVATNESLTGGQSDYTNVNIIEHKTGKGKTLRGVVRNDLTVNEAKAIDPYTFKKDGGYFIREKHSDQLPPKPRNNENSQGINENSLANSKPTENTAEPAQAESGTAPEAEQQESESNKPKFLDVPEISNPETEALAQELAKLVADGKTMDATNKLKEWQAKHDQKGKMAKWEQQAIIDRAKTIADQIKSVNKQNDEVRAESEQPVKDQFADNKLFTSDMVAAARARLKSKLANLNSGLDPEIVIDGMTITCTLS